MSKLIFLKKKHHIIAIDGHSSTGKSTLAKQLAEALDFLYIDTGAMYRAVTFYAMKKGWLSSDHFDKEALLKSLADIHISFKKNPETGRPEVLLNGENIEKEIRNMEVSNLVSIIAAVPEVRKKLVAEQRKMAENQNVVMDGRDIGSVVFPNADIKIFMTASPEMRATRRYNELKEKGLEVSYEEVLKNVNERDKMDSERKDSPLVKTKDAIVLDNTNMSKKEQFQRLFELISSIL